MTDWPGRISRVAALIASGLIAGCACPSSGPDARASFPADAELVFSSSGFPIGNDDSIWNTKYTVRTDGRITRGETDGSMRERSSTRRMTAGGLKRFRAVLARLRVGEWKEEYQPRETIEDGFGWTLELREGDHFVKSFGANAGPSVLNPKRTVELDDQPEGDTVLREALDELWKRSAR
jgi:hypothetical protein